MSAYCVRDLLSVWKYRVSLQIKINKKNIINSLYVCLMREVICTGARLLKEFMILMTYEGQHVTHGHERRSYIEGTQGVYATVYAVCAELYCGILYFSCCFLTYSWLEIIKYHIFTRICNLHVYSWSLFLHLMFIFRVIKSYCSVLFVNVLLFPNENIHYSTFLTLCP